MMSKQSLSWENDDNDDYDDQGNLYFGDYNNDNATMITIMTT